DRMRAGERGTLRLAEEEAATLGLTAGEVVAAYAPIRVKGGRPWSAATLTSLSSLRSHERELMVRLLGAAGAITLLLLGFGSYLVIVSRRAVATRERLRHAEVLAHLHEKTEKILDHIPSGVLVLSSAGRVTGVNQALKERIPQAIGLDLATA